MAVAFDLAPAHRYINRDPRQLIALSRLGYGQDYVLCIGHVRSFHDNNYKRYFIFVNTQFLNKKPAYKAGVVIW